MDKNYFTYPKKVMNITQSYFGTYSHYEHTTGTPKDYPIDDAGVSDGHDAIYCNCDELEVIAIRGIGNKDVTNTIWLCSTTPVVTPTFTDYAFVVYIHPNDEDLNHISIGQKFKRGDIITYEGSDGNVTGPHVHIVTGRGKSDNWAKSSTNKWVITGNTKKPEEVFFIDPEFTQIVNMRGLSFQTLPKGYVGSPVEKEESRNQLEVLVKQLRTRKTPNGEVLGYINLGFYNILNSEKNGDYTWYQVEEDKWIAYGENWITLYPKKEDDSVKEENEALKEENKKLKQEIADLKKLENFSFTCERDGNYYIFLRANEILKIYSNS